ncbi:protoheme IX farnesyltransferase NDAI_0K01130 [Naumovozyma dairenensis CBS 421]|uniref:Protoheme IX farnesyltransferase, mitochondrial n=1 Tax=Naumovozyma dairenensis (strain ATCC 10597 / BCRC 20456 / CBS 421 / NBRC 0211 / NRRL Y-12639) TaxID=1071378 RepID=G0WHP3_NAUDC|nr:hypothetical protein NDAI_0K01130 [Naumovozyma dairenensis CBS 421]CCD27304.1 hypothetical protein NDAI_0K01130 [Naumovozyma dairenensis CBS 421]
MSSFQFLPYQRNILIRNVALSSLNCRITCRFSYVPTRNITTNQKKLNVHVSTKPIEFTSNLIFQKQRLESLAEKATNSLRCTDDITPDESTTTGTPVVNTAAIPFNVKPVDPRTRKLERSISASSTHSIQKRIIDPYLQLTKPRLTILVMLSAICSYALSPYPATITQLTCLTIGTTMCSGAANAINMGREPEYDRQMTRTHNRPVVRGLITPTQAYQFAGVMGFLGTTILYAGVNPLVASLGASNIVLYSWIYTSLKRKHIINTWIGALVGALPPLMGWAAASPLSHPGAWVLATLLYAWQFPHFNALSHNVRNEYKNAGYVMTAWKNPKLNARVALRYTLLMFPLCFGLSYFNITDWYYQFDSAIVNAWLSYWAFKFYWQQRLNYSKEYLKDKTKFNKGISMANVYARKLSMTSVLQLPVVLLLAILHKKGRWDWLFDENKNNNSTGKKLN